MLILNIPGGTCNKNIKCIYNAIHYVMRKLIR